MPITELLAQNAALYRDEVALVEINPALPEEKQVTWKEYSLIEASVYRPFRTELTWGEFERRANRFANLRGIKKATGGDSAHERLNGCRFTSESSRPARLPCR